LSFGFCIFNVHYHILEPIRDLPPSLKCYVFGCKTSSRANRNYITFRAPTCFSPKNLHFRDGYREIVDRFLGRVFWPVKDATPSLHYQTTTQKQALE